MGTHKGKSSSASSDAAKDQKNRHGQKNTRTESALGGMRVEGATTKGNPGNHRLPK
jgi:hypothetical protein